MLKEIVIRGARENNLKNIDLTVPRDKLVVFTGLSGSGKTSLAFDTLHAEGHRRFVESLSSYARMFLGQLDKPDVDSIDGLSPSISIDQKTTSKNRLRKFTIICACFTHASEFRTVPFVIRKYVSRRRIRSSSAL